MLHTPRGRIILERGKPYLLEDGFNASQSNPQNWLLVDTGTPAEALDNRGFESAGGGGADVFANWEETAGGGSIIDEGVIVHGGSHSAKLIGTTPYEDNTPDIRQSFAVVPGFACACTAWVAGDGTNAGRYYVIGNTGDIIIPTSTGVTAAVYSQISFNFTVPAGCSSAAVGFKAAKVNGAFCYVDDVSALLNYGLISVASGLLSFSGGKATPAHGDPMAESVRSFTRRAGLSFLAKVRADTVNANGPYCILANKTPFVNINTDTEYRMRFGSAGLIYSGARTSDVGIPVYSAGTSYWFLIILRATGADCFYSTDGHYYYRLWNEPAGTTSPLYVVLETYSQAGAVDEALVWQGYVPSAILSGTPAALSISLGTDRISNGNMETGDPPTGWLPGNVTLDGVADERTGGAGIQSLSATNTAAWGGPYANPSFTVGVWYLWSLWFKNVTADGSITMTGFSFPASVTSTPGTWANYVWCQQCTTASPTWNLTLRVYTSSTGKENRWDDVSAKPLTWASQHSLLGDAGTKHLLADYAATAPSGYEDGCYVCGTADQSYGLYAYTNGTNVRLMKVEAGVSTVLIDTATGVTYAAGRIIRIVTTPVAGSANSSVAVYYQSTSGASPVQIGTTQTIDLTLYGTLCGRFGTQDGSASGLQEVYGGVWL